MGRSLQQIVRGLRNMGVGSVVVAGQGGVVRGATAGAAAEAAQAAPKVFLTTTYTITQARAPGGASATVDLWGVPLGRKGAVPERLHSTFKKRFSLVVNGGSDAQAARAALVEKTADGALRLSDAGMKALAAAQPPFEADVGLARSLIAAKAKQSVADKARIAAAKAEAKAAPAAPAKK